jgi:conjugative relaxase-like TrwC/TraI family protein
MLTISSGYDPGYLTRSVATGRENYYLSAVAEHGEPPGIWTGLGCPELGLPIGSEVDTKVMERLYGAFLDPRDPKATATLGRAPSGFGGNDAKVSARITALLEAELEATPERRDQIIMQALKDQRAPVYFFDVTFSVPKSVSLLHAAYQVKAQQARQAGRADEAGRWEERAQAVWDAVLAGNQAMLAYLQREAGYSRAGYHSRDTGRYADAHQWVIASFAQHTSRDNDPQLHVHNAVLNRVLRDDPLASRPADLRAWRTLDGAALYAAKPAAAAIAERTLAEHLRRELGAAALARPDGNGWEVAGISQAARDQFSSRRRAIVPRVGQLIKEYQHKHGKPPDARAVWSMAQFVTLDSRRAKDHSAPSRHALLERWETQSRCAETTTLSAIPGAVNAAGRAAPKARELTPKEVSRVLAAAVADAQQHKATFTRYELTRMINRHLPDFLGGLPGDQVTALLEELTSQALRPGGPSGVVLLTAPDMVAVPACYRRADGLSLWRRHGDQTYTTGAMLDTETRLLCAAAHNGAPKIAPGRAAAALGADRQRIEAQLWREHGHPRPAGAAGPPDPEEETPAGEDTGAGGPLSRAGLAEDQAQAAYGILTSGRAIDILIGPAGTGKTRTVATIAKAWRRNQAGRVIGLTTSTSAAHVLAAQGLAQSHNLAVFLGRIKDSTQTRGHLPVHPGDLLVVDEASMVTTSDLAAVEQIATRHGAKILLTGDTAQLSAPEAGGMLRLLAGEHGYYQLHTVQRFEQEWERQSSLRLRAGDTDVLAEYDQRGRILAGTREQMAGTATRRWLADYLSGQDTLLLATTSAQAADLARRARDELAALGLVATSDLTELADGNLAGPGDQIVARQNERIEAGEQGRLLANRDVLRIEVLEKIRGDRMTVVRRIISRDPVTGQARWSDPFDLPENYLESHASLAYASNVHVAEGRTVHTGHLVIDQTAGREHLYVGMSRGRDTNTMYVVTEPARTADLAPGPRPAPALQDPAATQDTAVRPGQFAVLAEVMGHQRHETSATGTLRQELEQAASLATLAPIWAELTRAHATRGYEDTIASVLGPLEWQQYQHDPERGTLTRLLRAADLAGHDTNAVLRQAAGIRDFAGARSIAAVLHSRVRQITGTPQPRAGTYADRTPLITDPEAAQFARDLAAAMDARAKLLGERAAADRPVWALRYLGDVPDGPPERAEWMRRAAMVAAYREEHGYTHDSDPIGPAPASGSPEQRASWQTAYAALRLPGHDQETAAATDGQLWARRAAYTRETAWAPPYVASELRDAHLAEDTYRADAIRAWYQADAARTRADDDAARQEAEQLTALAQDVGRYRQDLTEIADARRQWHAATEASRHDALMADAELRRRHPDAEIAPVHPPEEAAMKHSPLQAVSTAGTARQARPAPAQPGQASPNTRADPSQPARRPILARKDVRAALETARRARQILAARERHHASHDAGPDSEDVMRRREAAARQEAAARRAAVRQDPAPSRHIMSLEHDEPELEA